MTRLEMKQQTTPDARLRYKEVYNRAETFMSQLPENRDKNLDSVYRNFFAITGIPRKSKQEAGMGDFLEVAGQERKYTVERDSVGNVLWRIPASSPEYNTPEASVVIQTHQDMVCVGAPDPAVHGVEPEVFQRDNSWFIRSKDNQSTLGADDAIMVATAMELPTMLEKAGIPHGEMALIFTTDEEQGLNGAKALQFDLSHYGNYLNLDSEWDGEITIGSAGVGDSEIKLPVQRVALDPSQHAYVLAVSGLKGGHSGVTIGDATRQNAVKVAAEVLTQAEKESLPYNVISFEAVGPMNAIPDKATVVVATDAEHAAQLQELANQTLGEFASTEKPGAAISIQQDASPYDSMLDAASSRNFVELLNDLPHGVKLWEDHDPNLVKTSTNLATVELAPQATEAKIGMMSRSSDNNELTVLRETDIAQIVADHGATLSQDEASPAWEPVAGSDLAALVSRINESLFGKPMPETVTHGGLETSHVIHLYPHFQGHIVSIGANVNNAHEVMEETEGPSVERIAQLTMGVIGELANQGKRTTRRSA